MTSTMQTRLSRSLRRNLMAGTFGMFLLFAGVGGWAATTELSGAVIASGMFVIEGNAKKVQHPEGGIIADLRVREGQLVHAGETLIRMDDTALRASLAAVEKSIVQLLVRQVRLEAERDGRDTMAVPPLLKEKLSETDAQAAMADERRLFEDRRIARSGQKSQIVEQAQQLREQIAGLDVQRKAKVDEIDLIEKELEGKRRLYEMGAITLNQVNTLDRSAVRLVGERGQFVASAAAAKGRIAELELQMLVSTRN